MKKLLLFLLMVPGFAVAQDIPHHLDPTVAAVNKEPARLGVVRREAQWVQEFEEWSVTQNGDNVAFSAQFRVPFEWIDRRQFLCLDGVSSSFDVEVNGKLAGYSQTGAGPSEFDITDVSREGLNELRIVVWRDGIARKLEDGRPTAEPQLLDDVRVISQPLLRVRDVSVDARYENANGLLELGVVMRSHRLNALKYNVSYELVSPEAEVVAWEDKDFSVDMLREDTVRFFANVRGAKEWRIDSPTLYTLIVKSMQNGRVRERVSYKVAFLSATQTAKREFVMREFSPSGYAESDAAAIEALKKEGVNTLIISALPAADEFYDLCDRTGMYLCPTVDIDTHLSGESKKVGGNPSNDPIWSAAYRDRVLGMYDRAKGHPSVAIFRLAADGSGNGINLYDNYLMLKQLEASRPVIYKTDEWNTDF